MSTLQSSTVQRWDERRPRQVGTGGVAPGLLHDRTLELAGRLLLYRDELLKVLTRTATRSAAEDEINRSVSVLSGAAWEISRNGPPHIDHLGVFLPSNNILYSYVLFGLVPSLYSNQIDIRPSSRTSETAHAVQALLEKACGQQVADRIQLVDASQRAFVSSCTGSDAVVFTGQHSNGLQVMEKVGRKPLFLLFGSGPNPFIIGPKADPAMTLRALLASRLYNSGQDCLCSDLVFVHRSVLDQVLVDLKAALKSIDIADRGAPGAVVSPLVYPDAVQGAEKYLTEHGSRVVFGGGTDAAGLTVEPTVVVHQDSAELHPPEFFAPIFCLAPYSEMSEIEKWASTPEESARGMYATVYGEDRLTSRRLGTAVVLREATTFDHEDGNRPFGGYGPQANTVRDAQGVLRTHPLLLSAELNASEPG